jgi:hypothetical protein
LQELLQNFLQTGLITSVVTLAQRRGNELWTLEEDNYQRPRPKPTGK